jgi:hypothetical protein
MVYMRPATYAAHVHMLVACLTTHVYSKKLQKLKSSMLSGGVYGLCQVS